MGFWKYNFKHYWINLFNPLAFIIFGIIGALIGIIVAHGRRMNNITQYLECARCLILLSTAGYIFGGEIGGILSEFTGLAYCLQRRSFKELSRMVNGLAGVALGGNIGIILNALYSLPLASITSIIFGSIGGWLSLKFSKNISFLKFIIGLTMSGLIWCYITFTRTLVFFPSKNVLSNIFASIVYITITVIHNKLIE